MGKRSTFARRAQDAYDTPAEAVAPLVPHLPASFAYWEPCAGSGRLFWALPGNCMMATDIEPRHRHVDQADALTVSAPKHSDYIITNPPWTREILHPMIVHFSDMRPTWLLFDADWMHTKQAIPFLSRCCKIVSVGRVKWIEDSKHTGKDNAAWYLFDARNTAPTRFYGRAA